MAAWSEIMLKNKGFPYSAVALLLLAVAATNAKRLAVLAVTASNCYAARPIHGFPPECAMPRIGTS